MKSMSQSEYESKRMTARKAVAGIRSGADIAIGMAVAEPPALLAALAARVEAGGLTDLNPWYFHSLIHASARPRTAASIS